MKLRSKIDYLIALDNAHVDPDSRKIIEELINEHLGMIRHMKYTSLMDVYEYEETLTKRLLEPLDYAHFDNKRLKKEVNELRLKLGMIEKYKTEGTEGLEDSED